MCRAGRAQESVRRLARQYDERPMTGARRWQRHRPLPKSCQKDDPAAGRCGKDFSLWFLLILLALGPLRAVDDIPISFFYKQLHLEARACHFRLVARIRCIVVVFGFIATVGPFGEDRGCSCVCLEASARRSIAFFAFAHVPMGLGLRSVLDDMFCCFERSERRKSVMGQQAYHVGPGLARLEYLLVDTPWRPLLLGGIAQHFLLDGQHAEAAAASCWRVAAIHDSDCGSACGRRKRVRPRCIANVGGGGSIR